MKTFPGVTAFCAVIGLAFTASAFPCPAQSVLKSEPLILAPYEIAFVRSASCPVGNVLKVTGAIRGLSRRKLCVSLGRDGFATLAMAETRAGHVRELETVKPVFERALPNVPGKDLVALVVNYPPGGKSPAHRHAKSAFIYAFVLTGAIRSGVGTEPSRIYQAGQSFYEEPGAQHRVSENASQTQPASLLAVFIVDAEDKPLTVPDSNQTDDNVR
jgi:quercetin dioxygenase-like cupin family protein